MSTKLKGRRVVGFPSVTEIAGIACSIEIKMK